MDGGMEGSIAFVGGCGGEGYEEITRSSRLPRPPLARQTHARIAHTHTHVHHTCFYIDTGGGGAVLSSPSALGIDR